MGAEVINGPALLTEEAVLPVGVGWAGKTYKVAVLRAEQFGDQERAFDLLTAEDPDLLSVDEGEEIPFPVFRLAAAKRLMRITEIRTEDNNSGTVDRLTGQTLRQALKNGLWPADGQALAEADARLGKKLPPGSGFYAAKPSTDSASESSATPAEKSGE